MYRDTNLQSEQAHKQFSTHCFNLVWDLIEKTHRSPEENDRMVHLAHASLWHWTQRSDCTDKNVSIGYWQLSRVYSLLGEASSALKYAQRCMELTPAGEAFYQGYAYEALARAALVVGDREEAQRRLSEARQYADSVSDGSEKQMLSDDLDSLSAQASV